MLSVDACKKYVMVQVSEVYKNSEDGFWNVYAIPHLQNILMWIKILVKIIVYQFLWLKLNFCSMLFYKCVTSWYIWQNEVQDEKL